MKFGSLNLPSKGLAWLCICAMLAGLLGAPAQSVAASAADTAEAVTTSSSDDLSGHWAEDVMRQWAADSYLTGYGDGSYQPERTVSRGEFMAFINRSFQLTAHTDASFTDMNTDDWVYQDVAIAVQAGYAAGYEDSSIRWRNEITREQAAIMVAKLLQLESGNMAALSGFSDAGLTADWSVGSVAALAEAELLTGYTDGTFRPQGNLTRAQAVTLLQKALEYKAGAAIVYDQPGTYGPEEGTKTVAGNVVIAADGVTLRNTVIEGDLTITEAVGEGDAHIQNVTVKGSTNVQGGGANSIYFEDCIIVSIIVDKKSGHIRIVLSGDSTAESAIIQSEGTELDLGEHVTILHLVLESVTKIVGKGIIEKATIQKAAKESSFEKKPTTTDGEGANTMPPVFFPPGGGGTPTGPTPTPEPDKEAVPLTELKFGEYELKRSYVEGSGFDPEVTQYETVRADIDQPISVPVTLRAEGADIIEYEVISLSVPGYKRISSGKLDEAAGVATLSLPPKQDVTVVIRPGVETSHGIVYTGYFIDVHYPRAVQEAFSLYRERAGNHYDYFLKMEYLNGIRYPLNADIVIQVFDAELENLLFVCERYYACKIPVAYQPADDFTWYIKVALDGEGIGTGEFHSTITSSERIEQNPGVTITPYTREELIAKKDQLCFCSPDIVIINGALWTIDPEQVKQSLPDAIYVNMIQEEVSVKQSVYTTDAHNELWGPSRFILIDDPIWPPIISPIIVDGQYPNNQAHDYIIYTVFYDEQMNVIGYYPQAVTFDESTVAEGYAPTNLWDPDGGFGDGIAPDYDDDLDLIESLRLTRYRGGNHYNYMIYSSNAIIPYDTTVSVFASKESSVALFTCDLMFCLIPIEHSPKDNGSWYIKAYRNDTLVAEGTYAHSFTPSLPIMDNPGIVLTPYTSEQLKNDLYSICPYCGTDFVVPGSVKWEVDLQSVADALPEARYVSMYHEQVSVPQSTYVSDWKNELWNIKLNLYELDNETIHANAYVISSKEYPNKYVNDNIIYSIFYDENMNVIGHYAQAVEFTPETVAEGYTPTNLWNPDGDYGDGISDDGPEPPPIPIPVQCYEGSCDHILTNLKVVKEE
ncbi:S-layer homology domain-containing protein [Paenibacillus sp. J5C_2022]|uniref:S-layer homology domain-containing protein n=1 Tax=Paenibacillus sp. J5C2022 TaxID=2977129 RepID=UPI0021D3AF6B|nr:S-layer homology domain-containing protein [Paenibacillus sp. J5C2022]MCU6707731.1 S-layer homology domain-containing protein [Paenibacillus sp. J5C2022]